VGNNAQKRLQNAHKQNHWQLKGPVEETKKVGIGARTNLVILQGAQKKQTKAQKRGGMQDNPTRRQAFFPENAAEEKRTGQSW